MELAPVQAVLSCGKLNDGRLPDGEMAANLEERDSQAVRSARATVPSGDASTRYLSPFSPLWLFAKVTRLARMVPAFLIT